MFLCDFTNGANGLAEFKRRYEKYLNNQLNDLSGNGMIRINSTPGYRITEPTTNIKDEVDRFRGDIKDGSASYRTREYLRDSLGGSGSAIAAKNSNPLLGIEERKLRVMQKRKKRLGDVMKGGLDPQTYKTGSGENFNVVQNAKESAERQAQKMKDFQEKLKLDNEEFIRKARESAADNVGKSSPKRNKAYDDMMDNLKNIKVDYKNPFKPKWYNSKAANIGKIVAGGALGGYALKKAYDYQKKNEKKQIRLGF